MCSAGQRTNSAGILTCISLTLLLALLGGSPAFSQTDPIAEAWYDYQAAGLRLDRANERLVQADAAMQTWEEHVQAGMDAQSAQDRDFQVLLDRYNQKKAELVETLGQRDDALERPLTLLKEIEILRKRLDTLLDTSGNSAGVMIQDIQAQLKARYAELDQVNRARQQMVDNQLNPAIERLRVEIMGILADLERNSVVRFDPVAVLEQWLQTIEEVESAREEQSSADAAQREAVDAYAERVAKLGPPFLRSITVKSDVSIDGSKTLYAFAWQADATATARINSLKLLLSDLERAMANVRQIRTTDRQNRLRLAHGMLRPTRALNEAAEGYAYLLQVRVLNVAFTDMLTTFLSIYVSGGMSGAAGRVAELKNALGTGWRQALKEASSSGELKKAFYKGLKPDNIEAAGDIFGKLASAYDDSSYAQPYNDIVTGGPITTKYDVEGRLAELEAYFGHGPLSDAYETFGPATLLHGEVTASPSTDQTFWRNQMKDEIKEWLIGDVIADSAIEMLKDGSVPSLSDILDLPSLAMTAVSAAIKASNEDIFASYISEYEGNFWKQMTLLQTQYAIYNASLLIDQQNAKNERDLARAASSIKAKITGIEKQYTPSGGTEAAKVVSLSVKQLTVDLEFSYPLNSAPVLRIADEPVILRGGGQLWSAEWPPSDRARSLGHATLEVTLGSNSEPYTDLDTDPRTTPYIDLPDSHNSDALWLGYERGVDSRHVLRFEQADTTEVDAPTGEDASSTQEFNVSLTQELQESAVSFQAPAGSLVQVGIRRTDGVAQEPYMRNLELLIKRNAANDKVGYRGQERGADWVIVDGVTVCCGGMLPISPNDEFRHVSEFGNFTQYYRVDIRGGFGDEAIPAAVTVHIVWLGDAGQARDAGPDFDSALPLSRPNSGRLSAHLWGEDRYGGDHRDQYSLGKVRPGSTIHVVVHKVINNPPSYAEIPGAVFRFRLNSALAADRGEIGVSVKQRRVGSDGSVKAETVSRTNSCMSLGPNNTPCSVDFKIPEDSEEADAFVTFSHNLAWIDYVFSVEVDQE